jgi:hypothetical protein
MKQIVALKTDVDQVAVWAPMTTGEKKKTGQDGKDDAC